MKKKVLTSIITLFILLSPISIYAENDIESDYKANVTSKYVQEEQKQLENVPTIGCKAFYVAEPTTGKVFYEKNAHEKMYPASTTKILTALLVMEKCQLTDKAKVSKNSISLVPEGYSNAALKVGEELTVKDLLYALLVPSANEAANVLAEHVSGSVEAFAELCNNRAKELGCENLHFVNPNGIHNENHYCTAYDLYLIAKECRKHDIFNEIVKTTKFTLPATNMYSKNDRVFTNTNSLILNSSKTYYYPYCTGIKTGTTTPAGECLVASSSYNNIELISVVLDGGTNNKGLSERFYDTKQLFEFVYNNYEIKEISNKETVIQNIKVEHATEETASLNIVADSNISTILPKEIDANSIQKKITINENITAPIEKNQVLGQVTFYADGLEYTTNLIATHSVEKLPYWLYNTVVVIIGLIILIVLRRILNKKFA